MWVPEIELRSSSLVASTFTGWTSLPAYTGDFFLIIPVDFDYKKTTRNDLSYNSVGSSGLTQPFKGWGKRSGQASMCSLLTRALNLVQSGCFFLSWAVLPAVNKRLLFVCSFLFSFVLLEANIPYLPTKIFLVMEEYELVPQFIWWPCLTFSDIVIKKWGGIPFPSVSTGFFLKYWSFQIRINQVPVLA